MERILTSEAAGSEDNLDNTIRPKKLADYVGQPNVHEQLSIFIDAARGRGESLDHASYLG